jgi:L-ribulose-5-phosphate 4-epimerase
VQHLRIQIAAATRMLADAAILGYSGHLSVRAGSGHQLLIQSADEPRAGLSPEQVLLVDFDDPVRVREGAGRPPSELAIHAGIYQARPDVGAIAHFHHDRTTAFAMVAGCPLVPVKNHAYRWSDGIPVHPDPSHISSPDQGRALAATLGSSAAALLRGHGEVVVAEDIPTLFADVVHFVENADALARAVRLGPVRPLTAEECQRFTATFDRSRHARKLWRYYTCVAVERGRIPVQCASLEPAAAEFGPAP